MMRMHKETGSRGLLFFSRVWHYIEKCDINNIRKGQEKRLSGICPGDILQGIFGSDYFKKRSGSRKTECFRGSA